MFASDAYTKSCEITPSTNSTTHNCWKLFLKNNNKKQTYIYISFESSNSILSYYYCERSEPHIRVGWCIALVYIYIFVSMDSPFGPVWAPRECATHKRKAG